MVDFSDPRAENFCSYYKTLAKRYFQADEDGKLAPFMPSIRMFV